MTTGGPYGNSYMYIRVMFLSEDLVFWTGGNFSASDARYNQAVKSTYTES